MSSTSAPLRLLVRHSSSPKDAPLVEELLGHLKTLQRFAGIQVWSDAKIRAGDRARREIDRAIGEAEVVLLLLSADFFASDGLVELEVPQLLERHRAGQLRVIPVLLRSCHWEAHPWLKELHPLPRDGKPIASHQGDDRDRTLTELMKEIAGLTMPTTPGGTTVIPGGQVPGTSAPPVTEAGATYNIHIHGSTIGGIGVGRANVTGSVSSSSPATSPARPSRPPRRGPAANPGPPEQEDDVVLQSTYLSYGDADLPFARRLYEFLDAAGVTVFFREEHDKPGVQQHRVVRKGVDEYDHVLLICSKRSLDDPMVLAELENILGREHREGGAERIIPIWLDRYVIEGWKPSHPDVVHAVTDRTPLHLEGTEGDPAKFDKAMKRLLGALKG